MDTEAAGLDGPAAAVRCCHSVVLRNRRDACHRQVYDVAAGIVTVKTSEYSDSPASDTALTRYE